MQNKHVSQTIKHACNILNGLCQELDMVVNASDPFPVDDDPYYNAVFDAGYGCIEAEGGFIITSHVFVPPDIETALKIITSYRSEREN